MTYRELQQALKAIKLRGLTDIKLNASKEELQAEYDRTKDLKTLREELADRVAAGEVLYPECEVIVETEEQTEVVYTNSINHVLKNVFNLDYMVTVNQLLKSQNLSLKEYYRKLGLRLKIDPQKLLAKIDNYLDDKYSFWQHYHDHKKTIKENLVTFKKTLAITDKLIDNAREYRDMVNSVLSNVFHKNHQITTIEIINSLYTKVSDLVTNLTSTLNINTKEFCNCFDEFVDNKYAFAYSYNFRNTKIKSFLRHIDECIEYAKR